VQHAGPAAGAAPAETEDPLIGRVVNGRVKIISAIARGGMGKVYYGEQVQLGRPCAVKVFDPRAAGADATEFSKRFLLEASISSKLTHPNAITIFDYGQTEDGICYIAMEYLAGLTLGDELRKSGRLEPERAISIAMQIARALREAHSLGVVHRDMKPGNVFLVKGDDNEDFVKVLDFGLVKQTTPSDEGIHTQVGQIMGSPKYMAPEQIQGKEVDGRTDIYSLGAVLYTMLTGKPPFDRTNEMAMMLAHVSEAVPPMGNVVPDLMLPPGLEAVVMRCLAKEPAYRFVSMDELLQALRFQGPTLFGAQTAMYDAIQFPGAAAMAPPPSIELQEPEPARKNALLVWIGVGVGALAVVGGVAVFALRMQSTPEAPAVSVSAPLPVVTPRATVSSAPVATAVLHVVTEPAGARVKEDDTEVCAATPCDIGYKGKDADPKAEHFLVITKPGYRLERRTVRAGGERIEIKLSKASN
jgi:serine/threonine-protein kinase